MYTNVCVFTRQLARMATNTNSTPAVNNTCAIDVSKLLAKIFKIKFLYVYSAVVDLCSRNFDRVCVYYVPPVSQITTTTRVIGRFVGLKCSRVIQSNIQSAMYVVLQQQQPIYVTCARTREACCACLQHPSVVYSLVVVQSSSS